MKSHLTQLGIPGIGAVPYGTHLCHFYPTRQGLLDAHIPYFLAGMANNERGLWFAHAPLPAVDILKEISEYPRLAESVVTGQLIVMDSVEWNGGPSTLDAEKILQRLINEEERALADGYRGLRIAGNASYVPSDQRDRQLACEEAVQQRIRDRLIIICCSYPREDCRPIDFLEVARCHDAVIDRPDNHWQVFMQERQSA